MNKAKNDGRNLIVYHGRGLYHETCDSYGQRCLVKLSEMSCDCGVWQISGLPCVHAAAVIDYQGHSTHEYTNWYYSKEAFKLTYSGSINPIPDQAMWPDVEGAPPDPPKKRNSVGRPKKSRKRAADEGPAPSKCFTKRCTSCGVMGHNSRACKQPFAITKKKSKLKTR